jgi:hypothetical protein|mmetsp:Transcript_56548/g.93887  ORF Transcript_56548/g.93887 Transcript_56548/m.93887 type:complete len:94 (-) Transcript_56548:310-591(-)
MARLRVLHGGWRFTVCGCLVNQRQVASNQRRLLIGWCTVEVQTDWTRALRILNNMQLKLALSALLKKMHRYCVEADPHRDLRGVISLKFHLLF